jgi:hypothetical protein
VCQPFEERRWLTAILARVAFISPCSERTNGPSLRGSLGLSHTEREMAAAFFQ